jgi:hypothetical protein
MATSMNVRATGPIGTAARIAGGFAAIAIAIWGGLAWWEVALGLVGITLIFTFGHAALAWRFPGALRSVDQIGACLTAAIVTPLLFISYTSDATWLWLGASVLLAAVRGYAGCEVLAISNWLLRREDTVGCLIFTPIDVAEARALGNRTGNSAFE